MVNLKGENEATTLLPGNKIEAALNMAATQLEVSLEHVHLAQQALTEQAKNQFFDLQNGFTNTNFSKRRVHLEAKIRDNQITRHLISAIVKTSSRAELAMFYRQILCSPPKTTLLKAIQNKQLKTFPGLT